MGVTWEQINAGALGVADIITNGMKAANAIAGETTTVSPPASTASPAQASASSATAMSQSPSKGVGAGGLATMPGWAWAVLGLGASWLLLRRKR